MMAEFTPRIATANHLLDGDVIYFARPGWTRSLTEAAVAETPEDADVLLSEASAFPLETVGVTLTEVRLEGGRPAPAHFREAFRARGPSNYHHGKQADVSLR